MLILVALGAVFYFWTSEKAAQEQKQEAAKNARDGEQQRITFEAKQKEYCQAERKRWSIVPPTQIEIRNPTLTQKKELYGVTNDDYTFTASVKNKSKSKVIALRFNVTARDCPTQDARSTGCEVLVIVTEHSR
jgi:hypothetical protein